MMENSIMVPPPRVYLVGDHRDRQRGKELPNDIVTDILVRLPIRTCLRCKCVCKLWYDLITSNDFIVRHQTEFKDNDHKKSELSIYCRSFVRNGSSTTVSFRFFDVPIDLNIPVVVDQLEVVGCSNGLICLSLSKWRDGFVIWNPTTKQCRQIAGDYRSLYKNGYYSCGFCFNPADNSFKVVRIAISDYETQVNMFMSKANCWSSKELTADHGIGHRVWTRWDIICVGTRMYWDAVFGYRGGDNILCFDMVDESFSFLRLPDFRGYTRLGSHKGSLAMFVSRRIGSVSSDDGIQVWTMSNCCGTNLWSKRIVCTPSSELAVAVPLLILSKDDRNLVLVRDGCGGLFTCDPETGETKKLLGTRNFELNCCTYSESFASVY